MLFKASNRSEDYWISVSDLMAGLMILFLFIAISYMVKTQKENEMFIYIEQEYELAQNAIYEALFQEFKNDLVRWDAKIDKENLSFIFLSPDVLFKSGDSTLQERYKIILDDFFPRYIVSLDNVYYKIDYPNPDNSSEMITFNKKAKDNIGAIRIEGHANSRAPRQYRTNTEKFLYNMQLSADRSQSVLTYILGLDLNDQTPWVRDNVRSVGFSSSRPVFANEEEDLERSKRVEFRIVLDAQEKLFELIKKKKQNKLNEINYIGKNDFVESQVIDLYRKELFDLEKQLDKIKNILSDLNTKLKDLQKELIKLENKKSSLSNEIEDLDEKKLNLLNDINRLNTDIEYSQYELNNLENEILELNEDIYDLTIDRDYYQEKVDELNEIIINRENQYGEYLKNFNYDNYYDNDNSNYNPFSNNSSQQTNDDKDIILKPVLIGSISPIYPSTALKAGVGDKVTVSFVVGVDGKAKNIKIVAGGKYIVFKNAAIQAIQRAEWIPASKNGVSIEYPDRIPITFDPNK